MINEVKKTKTKTIQDVIFENRSFFVKGIGKYLHAREVILKRISSNNDIYIYIYMVNDCKNDLMFI